MASSSILIQKIHNWYGNNRNIPPEEPPIAQVGSVWTYRRVVAHLFKEDIAKLMKESGLQSTDKGWIKRFQQAVNEVIKENGGEKIVKDVYGKVAKQWNDAGVPEDLMRK